MNFTDSGFIQIVNFYNIYFLLATHFLHLPKFCISSSYNYSLAYLFRLYLNFYISSNSIRNVSTISSFVRPASSAF